MRFAGVVAAALVLLSLGGASRATDEDTGMSIGGPSRDEPPLETSSPKVKPNRNPNQPPALGPTPAKVEILVFCDYENPASARMRKAMRQLPEEFPGEARLEVRLIPAFGHPRSEAAALAALAAHLQGKFWPMNDCLLEHQDSLDDLTIESCATEAKLNMKRFAQDRTSAKLRARMNTDRDLIRKLGIMQAPGYTLNGRLYVGWGTWELFRGGMDEERRQMDKLLKSGTKLPEALRLRTAQNMPKNSDSQAAYAVLTQHLQTGTPAKKKT